MKLSNKRKFQYRRRRSWWAHRQLLSRAMVGLGVALAGYATWGVIVRYQATHAPITQALPPAAQTVTQAVGRPDETPIKPGTSYQVPADQPRQITMPTIGAQGYIQRVGQLPDGAIAVPTNIYLAGWYVEGPKPGDEGVAVLDGHLQGSYGPGIFTKLSQIAPGAEFTIEYGDGSRRHFRTKTITTYVLAEASRHLFDRLPGVSNQINLVTCAGDFDRGQGTYKERVIVAAERIMDL